jgi:hypothetical protein
MTVVAIDAICIFRNRNTPAGRIVVDYGPN